MKKIHPDGTIEHNNLDNQVEFTQYSKSGFTLNVDRWGFYIYNDDKDEIIDSFSTLQCIYYLDMSEEDIMYLKLKWGHIIVEE